MATCAPGSLPVRSERARSVKELVTGMRLNGLEPIPEFFRLSELYIEGVLTLDELACRCNTRSREDSAGSDALKRT
jgi:hypothetical protein